MQIFRNIGGGSDKKKQSQKKTKRIKFLLELNLNEREVIKSLTLDQ